MSDKVVTQYGYQVSDDEEFDDVDTFPTVPYTKEHAKTVMNEYKEEMPEKYFRLVRRTVQMGDWEVV